MEVRVVVVALLPGVIKHHLRVISHGSGRDVNGMVIVVTRVDGGQVLAAHARTMLAVGVGAQAHRAAVILTAQVVDVLLGEVPTRRAEVLRLADGVQQARA